MTRLRHYDHPNTARFVTFSCYRRYPFLVNSEVVALLQPGEALLGNGAGAAVLVELQLVYGIVECPD